MLLVLGLGKATRSSKDHPSVARRPVWRCPLDLGLDLPPCVSVTCPRSPLGLLGHVGCQGLVLGM